MIFLYQTRARAFFLSNLVVNSDSSSRLRNSKMINADISSGILRALGDVYVIPSSPNTAVDNWNDNNMSLLFSPSLARTMSPHETLPADD